LICHKSMHLAYSFSLICVLFSLVFAEVYFKEQFNDESWKERWVESTFPGKTEDDMGPWVWTAGKWYANENDKGIQTGEDKKHYGLVAKLNKPITNEDKDLVIQYTVKHEQKLDCGGAYLKLLGPDVDEKNFGGSTPYQIMFGPDICGTSTKKTHVIFNYPLKNQNLAIKNDVKVMTDQLSHLYTLVIRSNNTYEVLIDDKSIKKGNLADDWDFLLPREIKDPNAKKPADWVDEKMIPDPEDKKPDDWENAPQFIPDPEARKPVDWNDEEDGVWEAPLIDNPNYKGEWHPKMIPNPAYIGEWTHPLIPNPNFIDDKKLHKRCVECTHIGFELWQVKAGTIFDDIFITDSFDDAQAFAKETYFANKNKEKEMFDEIEKDRKEKEKEEREAKKKAREAKSKNKKSKDSKESKDHDEL